MSRPVLTERTDEALEEFIEAEELQTTDQAVRELLRKAGYDV